MRIRSRWVAALCLTMALAPQLPGVAAKESKFFARAGWLEAIMLDLYGQVQRSFKTQYDGSVWARSCRDPGMASKLGMNKKRLRAWVFDRLLERKDAGQIAAQEKWMIVHGVINMTAAYIEGGRAFVSASRADCGIALKGLHREFRD